MKLSDAILKGAQQRPQCIGRYFGRVGGEMGSCAMGAAYEAVFGAPTEVALGLMVSSRWGELSAHFPHISEEINRQIQKLNDAAGLSREEIAAWLAEQGL